MTASQNQPPESTATRLRGLVVAMVALFIIVAVFFRGSADEGDGTTDTTTPVASESTTTVDGEDDGPTTTLDGGVTPSTSAPVSDLDPLQSVEMDLVFEGFRQPVHLTAPTGDDRLFVVQRVGVIRILDEDREMLDPAFLDITDRVLAGGIEQGLLGMGFHPDYENNGRFFVYYTDKGGRRQLSEFAVSVSDPNRAKADSEKVLFELEHPEDASDIRHYGGNVLFGPDGYLWVSLGDGADSRDQGQDPNTMFASIVRIDVDNGDPYAVPEGNPFVTGGGAPEVWAYGLRNPWRFDIDWVDRVLYIADVGHADIEEVNAVSIDDGGGYNFAWSDMEGSRCFHDQECDAANYTQPVLEYRHDEGLSITGGYVYRGDEIPELHGHYFYADWVTQFIRSFKLVDGEVTEETDWTEDFGEIGQINGFGLDGHGEMYAVTHAGSVFKLTANR